ncbi:glycosyltransferase family 2 protein [Fibrobacter sp. UWH4]|uniref:glycosyltransferase family 2 protein n=1 Tax=Fibrobacter sp. UWH4 TaxID=1896210 RepID=UPI00091E21F4|nr:glycosyltransferase family 2 protein [Fibrobacter sp. UWH4]SHK66437.1 Glycosyl transferase family 2 [Fibrobacter sp. UWH4]
MKKVSIVVPLYKSEPFMNKLVDSVLNQTYQNIELILVDDESPDRCGEIADEYAKKDNRVVVIHKKNGGCCDARNAGLKAVSGEYLMLADGDDWMESDCVEYLVNIMETNNCQMSMSDCVFSTRDRKQNETDFVRVWSKERAACGILYIDTPIGPWNKVYTTKVIRDNNLSFSVPWFGEGLYFSVMAAQLSNQVAVGHRKVYNYRLNNPNSGTTVRQVENALSAQWNINNIKNNLIVRTPKTVNACNWHIYNNYFMVVMYIVGASAYSLYHEQYKNAKKGIRKNALNVLIHSTVSLKEKIRIIAYAISPYAMAKFILWWKKRQLKADLME